MRGYGIVDLGKDALVYGLGGVISKSLNVFLLPVMTRLFSLEQYGSIDLIALVIAFFNAVCILGMDSAIGVYYFEQDDKQRQKDLFSSYFWGVTLSSTGIGLAGIALAPWVTHAILKDQSLVSVFRVACLTVPATVILQALITLTRFQFKPKRYNLLVILNMLLNVALTVILVKSLSMQISGVFWARVFAATVVISIALLMRLGNIGFGVSAYHVLKLARYGLPLVPLALITYASNSMGRYFLKFYWSDAAIGKYAFALRISGIVGIAFTAFTLAFLPYASKLRFENNFHETINRIVKLFLLVSGGLILGGYVFSNSLVKLFGTSGYFLSEPLIVLGMLVLMLNATFQVFNIGVCYAKKTLYITVSQIVAMSVSFLMNILLVPRYEALGAFLSLLLGLTVANLLIFRISQSHYPIQYETPKIMELFAIIVIIGILSYWIRDVAMKLVVLLSYGIWGIGLRKYINVPSLSHLKNRFVNERNINR